MKERSPTPAAGRVAPAPTRGAALSPPRYGIAYADQATAVVQRKLLAWPNPHLTNTGAKGIADAKKVVNPAAVVIDDAVEEGADLVREYVGHWKSGAMNADKIKKKLNKEDISKAHVSNFVNKLIDWGVKKTNKSRAVAERQAGYIIEEVANREAKAKGIETQVPIDGARPDFRKQTPYTYTQGGQSYSAHGLIDATSASEAAKGHILEKVGKMSPQNALDHPILYDSYYTDLGFGSGAPKSVDLSGGAVKARAKYHARQAEIAKLRKSSLRSATRAAGKKKTKGKG